MTPIFDSERIVALCGHAASRVLIRIVTETASTNTDLLAGLNAESVPTLLIAETQTAGRGRAGRTWYSKAGAGLTFSLAWKFDCPVSALVGLPLASGVALAEALTGFGVHVRLKWPNDVLKNGKKLAGILIETAAANESGKDAAWAVIGIGMNLSVPDSLEAQVGQDVADAPWLAQMDRNELMASLLNALSEALLRFEKEGVGAFVERWNGFHAHTGQQVQVVDAGRILYEGTARGVDASGYLSIDTVSGRVAVLAGDVSLRATGER